MRRRSLAAALALVLPLWLTPAAPAQVLPFLSRPVSADQWERVRAAAQVPLAQLPEPSHHAGGSVRGQR